MTHPRTPTPDEQAEVSRVLKRIRPPGEGWEAFVDGGWLRYRRQDADGETEYWDIPAFDDDSE